MSEVKLNLIDSQQILQGKVHGSIADACVAALSAEPETISELEAALARYVRCAPLLVETKTALSSSDTKPALSFKTRAAPSSVEAIATSAKNEVTPFASLCPGSDIDAKPWDAGVVIIDLAARVVAAESSYSQPEPHGEVLYHDGAQSTELAVMYRVSDEWEFMNSLAEYESCRLVRTRERSARTPLDARSVLYGRALLEFIVTSVRKSSVCREAMSRPTTVSPIEKTEVSPAEADAEHLESNTMSADEAVGRALADEISTIHAAWLTTARVDLEGQSPRDILLAKREFIDFDLHTRELQWTFQGEGPPCLGQNSFAYRFAGFGTHECVVYYDLVRHLLWSAVSCEPDQETNDSSRLEHEIARLERIKTEWLETAQEDGDGWIPANVIENERRRLPLALSARDMIIDENCELCMMSANQVAMGYGPGFWHFDGSHMDDEFAFSFYRTREEWEEENRRREEFNREFERKWEERQQRLARGESVEDEFGLDWLDSQSEGVVSALAEDDESNLVQ